jgi:hypothetical protein
MARNASELGSQLLNSLSSFHASALVMIHDPIAEVRTAVFHQRKNRGHEKIAKTAAVSSELFLQCFSDKVKNGFSSGILR